MSSVGYDAQDIQYHIGTKESDLGFAYGLASAGISFSNQGQPRGF